MKHNYTITGDLEPVKNGLVDFIATGILHRDGIEIPCYIGFTHFENYEITPTFIFIKDGITSDGTGYYSETIEI